MNILKIAIAIALIFGVNYLINKAGEKPHSHSLEEKTMQNENSQNKIKNEVSYSEVYIDVRRNDEWAAGHLETAIHFELAKLEAGQMPDLAKDTPIAVYCRSGARAATAKQILQNNGFTQVRNAGAFDELRQTMPEHNSAEQDHHDHAH